MNIIVTIYVILYYYKQKKIIVVWKEIDFEHFTFI